MEEKKQPNTGSAFSSKADETSLVQRELEECKKQTEEYLNNWKRERADFLNYKKDEAKRIEEFAKFANEATILGIIDIIDDLERAVVEIKNEGLNQVLKKFLDLLNKYEVEKIKVESPFNPLLHEVVEGSEGDGLEEIRAGYTMHGKVIRPARVRMVK